MEWDSFQSFIIKSVQELQEAEDLLDVTLVCNDQISLDAHKVILAACSPVFRQLLDKSKHPHPLIFMPSVKSRNLGDILNLLPGLHNNCFIIRYFFSLTRKFPIQNPIFKTNFICDQILSSRPHDSQDTCEHLQ